MILPQKRFTTKSDKNKICEPYMHFLVEHVALVASEYKTLSRAQMCNDDHIKFLQQCLWLLLWENHTVTDVATTAALQLLPTNALT